MKWVVVFAAVLFLVIIGLCVLSVAPRQSRRRRNWHCRYKLRAPPLLVNPYPPPRRIFGNRLLLPAGTMAPQTQVLEHFLGRRLGHSIYLQETQVYSHALEHQVRSLLSPYGAVWFLGYGSFRVGHRVYVASADDVFYFSSDQDIQVDSSGMFVVCYFKVYPFVTSWATDRSYLLKT